MTMLRSVLLAGLALAGTSTAFAQDYRDPSPYYDAGRAGYDDPRGRDVRSVADFEAPLARYGRWVPSRFGRAWAPNVGRDWRPYTIGHWEQTEQYGWLWQSDEPFGWATYHYGRWGFDDRFGWVWLPDTVWGPAWVAWRDGDDYAGWAPLPPQVSFSVGFGSWDYDRWYAPSWVYVPRGSLSQRRMYGSILPYRDNRRYWDRTRGDAHRDGRWSDDGWRGRGPDSWRSGQGNAGTVTRPDDRRFDGRRSDSRGFDDRRPGWQQRSDGGDRRQGGYERPDGGRGNRDALARPPEARGRDGAVSRPLDPVPPAVAPTAPPVTSERGWQGRGERENGRDGRPGGLEGRGGFNDGGRRDGRTDGGGRAGAGLRTPDPMSGGRGGDVGGAAVAPPRAASPAIAPPPPQPAPPAPRVERPAPAERPAPQQHNERRDRAEGPVRDQ